MAWASRQDGQVQHRIAICFHATGSIEGAVWNDLQHEDRASAMAHLSHNPSRFRVVRIEYLDGDDVTGTTYAWWGRRNGPAGLYDRTSTEQSYGLQFESRRVSGAACTSSASGRSAGP